MARRRALVCLFSAPRWMRFERSRLFALRVAGAVEFMALDFRKRDQSCARAKNSTNK